MLKNGTVLFLFIILLMTVWNCDESNPVGTVIHLDSLNLPNNNLTDISFLEDSVHIQWLNLFNNPFSDISPLSGLSLIHI